MYFIDGIFLGITDRSDELIVFGEEGIRKARSIRRRVEGERWSQEELLQVRGTPLQPNPGRDDVHIRTRMEPGLAVPTIIGDPVTRQDVAKETGEMRRIYMLRSNVKEIPKRIGYI